MREDNKIVHAVWVGKKLNLMGELSIKLFQKHGHTVILWTYEHCEDVPAGTIIKDASEIMPRSSLFAYTGRPLPALVNGGIGSFNFWSEHFQMKLLYKYGGIYTQLDVTLLSPIDFSSSYIFVRHPNSYAQTCFMKCPKASNFTLETFKELQASINSETIGRIDWQNSMKLVDRAIYKHGLDKYFLPDCMFRNGADALTRIAPLKSVKLIHWWNSACERQQPLFGSLYGRLLVENGLWNPSTKDAFKLFKKIILYIPNRIYLFLKKEVI